MFKTRDAQRTMAAVLLALPLALAGAACTGDEAREVPRQATTPTTTPTRMAGEPPTTYGIDEVVPAAMTMESLFDVEPVDQAESGEKPAVGEPGFLLPDLGLVAGDGGDHQAEGEMLYQQRRFLEAAAHFQVAVEEKSQAWYSSYMLGLSLWKAGDLEGAASALQRAAEYRPGFTRTHVNLSRVFNDAGRHGEGLAAADRAVALEPDNGTAHYLRGRSLANLSLFTEAEEALRASLDLDPGNGDVWNRLGLMFLRQGRDEEAVAALEQAVESGRATAYIHNNLGLAYERGGRLQEAEQQFVAGLEADGEALQVAASLARVRTVLGVPLEEDVQPVPGAAEDSTGTEVAALTP